MQEMKKIQHTHDHDLTHSMVHYLFAIHKLKEIHGYARVTDIAKTLNLTKGSVSTALTNLKKKNLVVEDESRFLSLSEKGHEEVHLILANRTLLFYFFKDVLKVETEVAYKDSCLMEHLMSQETQTALFNFLKAKKGMDPGSTIDLSKFAGISDFQEGQKGDSHWMPLS